MIKKEKINEVLKKGDLEKRLKVYRDAKRWVYSNLELQTIQNRFFIMSEIEQDSVKKLSLFNLYLAVKYYNEIYGEKIENGKN